MKNPLIFFGNGGIILKHLVSVANTQCELMRGESQTLKTDSPLKSGDTPRKSANRGISRISENFQEE